MWGSFTGAPFFSHFDPQNFCAVSSHFRILILRNPMNSIGYLLSNLVSPLQVEAVARGQFYLGASGMSSFRGFSFLVVVISSVLFGCSENLGSGPGSLGLAFNTPDVTVFAGSSYQFVVSGGKPPYSFNVEACSGSVDASGDFQAPFTTGDCTVQAIDSTGATATAAVTVAAPTNTPGPSSPSTPTGTGYSWVAGGFGACSAACGGGTQSQTVTCEDSYGDPVDPSLCTETPPPTTQSCNAQACGGGGETWSLAIIVLTTSDPGDPACADACIPSSTFNGTKCATANSVCEMTCPSENGGENEYYIYECQ